MLGDAAGALERRRSEAPMRLYDVGWRRIRNEPCQVQDVAKGTDRSSEFDSLGYALGCEGIATEPVVEALEEWIGRRVVNLWNPVERDRCRAHEAGLEGGVQRSGDRGTKRHLGQYVHLGVRHDRSRQVGT